MSLDNPLSASFQDHDVCGWPEGARSVLESTGILKRGGNAQSVTCDGCGEGCLEDVVFSNDAQGNVAAYVVCRIRDDIGRVRVAPERLRTWVVSLGGLAGWLAAELGGHSMPEECVPGRLWWLGGPEVSRRAVDVFLACGATWPDADATFAHVGRLHECRNPIMLLPSQVPADNPFGTARCISLARTLSLEPGTLRLNIAEIGRVVAKTRNRRVQEVVPFPTPPGTKWKHLTIELVSDRSVKITIGNVTVQKTYEDLGFVDSRTTAEHPDKLWDRFCYLAECKGRGDWNEASKLDLPDALKKEISDLRKRLRTYFPITGDPFKPYRKVHAYETRFTIVDTRRAHR